MGLPEGDDLRFVIDDGQYRAVKSAIQASTRIAWAALISSIAVGGTVLILLTLLQLRSPGPRDRGAAGPGRGPGQDLRPAAGRVPGPHPPGHGRGGGPVAPHLPGGELAVPGQPHPAAPGERPRGAGPVPQRPGPHPSAPPWLPPTSSWPTSPKPSSWRRGEGVCVKALNSSLASPNAWESLMASTP